MTENPATRGCAEAILRSVLRRSVFERERVLVGFDFAYGYPRGFAAALGLTGTPWRAVWRYLTNEISDDPRTNINNRFEVAAQLNARLGSHVFWGRPALPMLAELSRLRDRVVSRCCRRPADRPRQRRR
jgi:hypothetical protein